MAAPTDVSLHPSSRNWEQEENCESCQAVSRKMRKTKTIGKRKLGSVKDSARRRAAREFLLGIKLDNDASTYHTPRKETAEETEQPVVSLEAAVIYSIEADTPTLSRAISCKSNTEEQQTLSRQDSLKLSSGSIIKENMSTPGLRSPFKGQLSVDQGEFVDHPLSLSMGREDGGFAKVTRSASIFHRQDDSHSTSALSTSQSYFLLRGSPCAVFSVLPFRKHHERFSRQGTRLFSSSQCLEIKLDPLSDVEESLGSLIHPVWTVRTLDCTEFQTHQLETYNKDLESWMKYIHGFWKDNHDSERVILRYHPDHLDNEEVFYGRRARTANHSSYTVSIIEYRKAETEKKDLNKRFRDVFPHIRITLSKIRSIKKEMRQVAVEMQLGDGVLCYAYVYFEKVILAGKAEKINRKFLAGASLLLAAKFLDIERSKIKGLIHEIISVMKVPIKELLLAELPLLINLQFSLFVPEHQYARHWERLRQEEK